MDDLAKIAYDMYLESCETLKEAQKAYDNAQGWWAKRKAGRALTRAINGHNAAVYVAYNAIRGV